MPNSTHSFLIGCQDALDQACEPGAKRMSVEMDGACQQYDVTMHIPRRKQGGDLTATGPARNRLGREANNQIPAGESARLNAASECAGAHRRGSQTTECGAIRLVIIRSPALSKRAFR